MKMKMKMKIKLEVFGSSLGDVGGFPSPLTHTFLYGVFVCLRLMQNCGIFVRLRLMVLSLDKYEECLIIFSFMKFSFLSFEVLESKFSSKRKNLPRYFKMTSLNLNRKKIKDQKRFWPLAKPMRGLSSLIYTLVLFFCLIVCLFVCPPTTHGYG
jgi:hypothetical protein